MNIVTNFFKTQITDDGPTQQLIEEISHHTTEILRLKTQILELGGTNYDEKISLLSSTYPDNIKNEHSEVEKKEKEDTPAEGKNEKTETETEKVTEKNIETDKLYFSQLITNGSNKKLDDEYTEF